MFPFGMPSEVSDQGISLSWVADLSGVRSTVRCVLLPVSTRTLYLDVGYVASETIILDP